MTGILNSAPGVKCEVSTCILGAAVTEHITVPTIPICGAGGIKSILLFAASTKPNVGGAGRPE
jgi:hypothetical protein